MGFGTSSSIRKAPLLLSRRVSTNCSWLPTTAETVTYTPSGTPVRVPERVAFSGVEKHSIVSVGSYGQLKDKVNRYYFEAGMDAMMEELEPEIVLVYSKMPDKIEEKYPGTRFVEYPDWTSIVRND